jgi:hypothetical protein
VGGDYGAWREVVLWGLGHGFGALEATAFGLSMHWVDGHLGYPLKSRFSEARELVL